MTQEALKLALEALEDRSSLMKWQEARDAVKEALAQPEQEPTWWLVEYHDWAREFVTERPEESIAVEKVTPLYTTPTQRPRVVFPTMLRKMWSGSEVQAWLDENVNKEKNNG